MPTKKAVAEPKVMDIAHPRTVKANATTVPLILTNRPILKDPMMNDDAAPKPEAAEKPKQKPAPLIKKIELQPLVGEETVEPKEATGAPSLAEYSKPEEPAELKLPIEEAVPEEDEHEAILAEAAEATSIASNPVEKAEGTNSETSTEPELPEEIPAELKPEEAETDSEPDVTQEALLPGTKPADEATTKAAREAAEKQLALEKLITEGTYILPINMVEKRRMHRTMLMVVILLIVTVVAVAGFILALDAGYLHIDGLSPPTDLIR